jgi:hypothetical protein
MKKAQILLLFILFTTLSHAQFPNLSFDYDASGNQTSRVYCFNCSTVAGKQSIVDTKNSKQSDLKNFFPNDILSYYPNPVKEELYLKWKVINDNNVVSLIIYNVSGEVLKKIDNKPTQDNATISFIEFPEGLYVVELNYSNENKETIKIIKN